VSSHQVHQLLHHYGLITVFLAAGGQALCLPIPGSTFVIAAAVYAAANHGLPITGVLIAAALGIEAGSLGGFVIGRWRGEWLLLKLGGRLRQSPERIHRLRRTLDRHAVIALIGARWFTGTRNLAAIASGASAMSVGRFAVITLIAALLWSIITSLEFYFFGSLFLGAPTWLKVLIVLAGILGTGLTLALVHRRAGREEESQVALTIMDEHD
jgi:membrane protein DedA with SNARE-associated domain